MSWQFGDIDFESYGVFVSKSTGVLDLPKLKTEGYDWLDEDGLDYWQETPKYDNREIILNCWMLAEADDEFTGYENFKTKVEDFLTEIKEAGKATFKTPYIDIEDCSISKGVAVIRETSYVLDIQAGTFLLRITVHGDLDFLEVPVMRWTGEETITVTNIYTKNLKLNKTLQGDIYISTSFQSPEKLPMKYFDYVEFNTNGNNNEVFHLASDPTFKKISSNKFQYDLRLEHQSRWLADSQFLNDLMESEFDYYANLEEIIDLIVTNHDRSWWQNFSKGTVQSTERRLHNFSKEDCMSVLKRMCAEYFMEFEFEFVSGGKYKINIKEQVANDKSITFEYGKGKGFYELTREPISNDEVCTILFAYGAAKNLKWDYRGGMKRLSFDGNPLKNNQSLHTGAGPKERTVFFDDIYPNRTAQVTNYFQKLPDDPTYTALEKEVFPEGIYRLRDSTLEFDINDHLLGLTAKVKMKTGALSGFEFEVLRYDHDTKDIYLIPFKDEREEFYPNENLLIEDDDYYTLVDIDQPASYVDIAEAELEAAAQIYLDNHSVPKFPYSVKVDPAFLLENPEGFEIGDRVNAIDDDYNVDGKFRISTLTFDFVTGIWDFYLSDTTRLTRRQELELRLKAVEKAQEIARKNTAESTRKDKETTNELRNTLLDPSDDKFRIENIMRNNSISPRFLDFDAGVPQFYLKNALVEVNVDDDEDRIRIEPGEISITNWQGLSKFEIAKLKANSQEYDPTRTWNIPETNINLESKDGHWLYAKISLASGVTGAVIQAFPEHIEVKTDIEDEILFYKLGHISNGEEAEE